MMDVALIGGMLYTGIVFVKVIAMGVGMIAGKECVDVGRRSRPSQDRFAGCALWGRSTPVDDAPVNASV
jgi:hypothetical protein